MGVLATLGRSGHVVTKWDVSLPETVDEAKVEFDEMLGKGFTAFRVVAEGKPTQIRKFEPDAEEIVVAPRFYGG